MINLGGRIFVLGGGDGRNYVKDVEEFDVKTFSWRKTDNGILFPRSDFSVVTACHQQPKETVTEFVYRFHTMWEANADIEMEQCNPLTVQTLLNGLSPNVATLIKLRDPDWQKRSFTDMRHTLANLDKYSKTLKLQLPATWPSSL